MAGALRKVSRDYDWTIKRADNDLHHNIFAPQPQTSSPSSPDTKSMDFSVLPWEDSNRFRWKFRTDYEELRDHLEHAFLILYGWAMTLNYLRTVATGNFISHPLRSVVALYEESANLAHLGICPTSIWGFPDTLLRFAAPFVVSLLWEFFGDSLESLRLHAETSTGDKMDATFASQIAEHPVVAELPVEAPHMSNDMQAPVKDNTGYDTSDAAPTVPGLSLADDRKGGSEVVHTVMHDEARRFSLRKGHLESHDARNVHPDPIARENPYVNGTQPFPKSPDLASHLTEAKVVKMRYHTDDFFAMGDESVLAYNPVSLALIFQNKYILVSFGSIGRAAAAARIHISVFLIVPEYLRERYGKTKDTNKAEPRPRM